MKRSVLIVAIVLACGFAAVFVWKGKQKPSPVATEPQAGLTAQQKAEILRFWEVYRRADDLKRSGEWHDAAAGYREALAIDPRHLDALYYLGNALFELEQYEDAIRTWRRLAEVNPLSTRAHIQLGAVHSCGARGAPFDLDVAEAHFQRALDINKEQTGPVLKLGEVNLLSRNEDAALGYFGAVLQSNPKSVEANYLMGFLKWRSGEREAALAALREAAKHSQEKKPVAGVLGEGDTRKGSAPMMAEGSNRKSFFAPYWVAFKAREDVEVSVTRMESEYRELDRQIALLVETKGAQ
jgi:tetratricopeptide (TPR) repeat protein